MKLLVIIPFFNESKRIQISDFDVIFRNYPNIDFLLVDDKSTDATLELLSAFSNQFSNVALISKQENSGKGASIREGVLSVATSDYTFLGYLDADLATPFEELSQLFAFASKNPNYEFVMGARIKLIGNQVDRSLLRHYFGRIFATIVSFFILKTPIYDTQCGAKIITFQKALVLFKEPFETKWLFDIELLLRLKRISQLENKVKEIPLEIWKEKLGSKIKLHEFFLFPFQLLKIYFKYDCFLKKN